MFDPIPLQLNTLRDTMVFCLDWHTILGSKQRVCLMLAIKGILLLDTWDTAVGYLGYLGDWFGILYLISIALDPVINSISRDIFCIRKIGIIQTLMPWIGYYHLDNIYNYQIWIISFPNIKGLSKHLGISNHRLGSWKHIFTGNRAPNLRW